VNRLDEIEVLVDYAWDDLKPDDVRWLISGMQRERRRAQRFKKRAHDAEECLRLHGHICCTQNDPRKDGIEK